MSPTARSLKLLRKSGYFAEVVEKWNPWSKTRRDLFGAFDVLGIHSQRQEFLFVQCTTVTNISARLAKVRAAWATPGLLKAGAKVAVWGWFQRNGRWQVKRIEVRGEDLDAETLVAPHRRQRKALQRLLF